MFKNYYRNITKISSNAKLFILGNFFVSFGLGQFMLLFNIFLKGKGFDEGQIGTILMCSSLGAATASIPIALLIERVHIKKILLCTIIIAAIASSLQVYNDKLIWVGLFAYIASIFGSACKVATSPFFMRNSTVEERTHLFSLSASVMMLSLFLGYMSGGWLPEIIAKHSSGISTLKSEEYALYIAIFITLIGLLPIVFLKQHKIEVKRIHWLQKIKNYDWHIIGKLMLPKLLVGLGAGFIIPFMNLYFKDVFNLDTKSIGLCYSGMQVAMIIAMLLGPILTKLTGTVNFIVLTELCSIPFMLILALTNNLKLAIMAFIVRGALMNMSWPISNKFEMELVKPEDQALTNAISQLAWLGSWAISAQIGGLILKKYNYAVSFYITIALYLVSAICTYLLFRNAKLHKSHR